MKSKQTAIDWLKELVDTYLAMSPYNIEIPENFYYEAKEKEREQIMDAWKDGSTPDEDLIYFAEKYYDETYNP